MCRLRLTVTPTAKHAAFVVASSNLDEDSLPDVHKTLHHRELEENVWRHRRRLVSFSVAASPYCHEVLMTCLL
jgi:hypothetical protein